MIGFSQNGALLMRRDEPPIRAVAFAADRFLHQVNFLHQVQEVAYV